MFHTIITLAYTIPNIYVFIRIWQLFINKGYRRYYTLIYIILALIYPLSNIISDGGTGIIASTLSDMADYILPFYLYIFLFVLAFDIFLIINLLFRFLPAGLMKSFLFKLTALSVILSLSALVVVLGVINFNAIRTSEYQIEVPARASKMRNLRIAFAADFHLQEETNIRFVERFKQKISDIDPDILLLGGDIVEGNRQSADMVRIEILIKQIKTKYGVFAVLGNHDYYAGQGAQNFFREAGIKVLRDTIIVVDSSFNLAGRDDSRSRSRKSIAELIKSADNSLPIIVIDHRPTEIDQVSKTSADVQLSGHTHNGQLFPINLITNKVYELSWGYMKKGNTHFFVTSGIRLWGPPVRTTGKSEIMVIDISFADQ